MGEQGTQVLIRESARTVEAAAAGLITAACQGTKVACYSSDTYGAVAQVLI